MQHLALICRWPAMMSALALGAGCAPPPLPADEAGSPSVEILYPQADGEFVLCTSFLVVVKSESFLIGDPGDGSDGHWHLVMDEVGGDSVPLGKGEILSNWPTSHSEVLEVSPGLSGLELETGEYSLFVILANEQHQMVTDNSYDLIESVRVDDTDPDCLGWPAEDTGR